MAGALETRAEILKLARLLGRDPADLDYLDEVPAEESGRCVNGSRTSCSTQAIAP